MSSDDDSGGWQLTESDPGVFTELLKTLGTPYIVDDLYSLESESLAQLQPIRALIFLFKWLPTSGTELRPTAGQPNTDFTGFFAHQTVNNACATLAVMNALGNIPSLVSGPQLADLFSFTVGMDPQTCGMAVTSADWLREAHNSLSPPSAISLDGLGLPKTSEDAYHFVVYLPIDGHVYEMDGLQQHPLKHGAYQDGGEGWLSVAREVIENRIATYPTGALEFSLLALRDDPIPQMEAQLKACQESGRESDANEVMVKISNENSKRERWAFENSLRRHNHMGMVHALLLSLAKAGKLEGATESAKKAMQERVARRREMGMSDMDED